MSEHDRVRFSLTLMLGLGLSAAAPVLSRAEEPKSDGLAPSRGNPQVIPNSARVLETPRLLTRLEDLGRTPKNSFGSLEATIQTLRAHRPLDLNAAEWRRRHPTANHGAWAREARSLLAEGLHYDTGKLNLNAVTTARWETDSFVRETIEFNTT